MNEVKRALDCLENCLIKVGNISREWLEHDSDMNNIRHHPRYEKIISSFPDWPKNNSYAHNYAGGSPFAIPA